MSESKHTPGPWQADRDNDVVAPDGTGIAGVHGVDEDEERANARLIAAAPTMLAVIKHFEEVLAIEAVMVTGATGNIKGGLLEVARAAIAKAEGK